MVKHIVCFKLKDRKKSEEAKEILLSMRGKVPTAQKIEVGVDFLGSARSYDVFLSVTVRDGQALTEYQTDPYHVGVVKNLCTRRRKTPLLWIFTSDVLRKGKNLLRKFMKIRKNIPFISLLIGKNVI